MKVWAERTRHEAREGSRGTLPWIGQSTFQWLKIAVDRSTPHARRRTGRHVRTRFEGCAGSRGLNAIRQLRERNVGLDDIRARLDAPQPPAPPAPVRPQPPKYLLEGWELIVLVPGVELHVNAAGGPMLRRMAEEIYAAYGPAPAEEQDERVISEGN